MLEENMNMTSEWSDFNILRTRSESASNTTSEVKFNAIFIVADDPNFN